MKTRACDRCGVPCDASRLTPWKYAVLPRPSAASPSRREFERRLMARFPWPLRRALVFVCPLCLRKVKSDAAA